MLSFFMLTRRFICLCILFCSCSEYPTEVPDVTAIDLAAYFAPISSIQRQVWSHRNIIRPNDDSMYFMEFVGQSSNHSADGYSPISFYQFLDSSGVTTHLSQYYVSDSLIVSYGDSASQVSTRLILLKDTLKKGIRWLASENYHTPDSAIVQIDAAIIDYYPNITVRDSVYQNVYRIEYTIISKGRVSTYPEYRNGSRHIWYFARGVGVVLQYVYGTSGESLWKNELIEQRIK